jgi:hypothetical protein
MITSELYLLHHGPLSKILVPNSDGIPSMPEAPLFALRCDYLSPDFAPQQFIIARDALSADSGFKIPEGEAVCSGSLKRKRDIPSSFVQTDQLVAGPLENLL